MDWSGIFCGERRGGRERILIRGLVGMWEMLKEGEGRVGGWNIKKRKTKKETREEKQKEEKINFYRQLKCPFPNLTIHIL